MIVKQRRGDAMFVDHSLRLLVSFRFGVAVSLVVCLWEGGQDLAARDDPDKVDELNTQSASTGGHTSEPEMLAMLRRAAL